MKIVLFTISLVISTSKLLEFDQKCQVNWFVIMNVISLIILNVWATREMFSPETLRILIANIRPSTLHSISSMFNILQIQTFNSSWILWSPRKKRSITIWHLIMISLNDQLDVTVSRLIQNVQFSTFIENRQSFERRSG